MAQNMVRNGDYESDLADWVAIQPSPDTEVSVDFAHHASGASSLRLKVTSTDSSVTAGVWQSIPMTPGTTYLFSYTVKTEHLDHLAFPFLKFSNGGDIFNTTGFSSGGTTDWTSYSMRIATPPRVNSLDLFFFLVGRSGTAWLDDVSLTAVSVVDTLRFSVDLDAPSALFNPGLIATNSSPIRQGSQSDLRTGFREIGIEEVRTHDILNACDIHVVFPDFSADPLDASAYDFSSTDSVIASIYESGATALFRLGESFHVPTGSQKMPSDFDKWSSIGLQIIKHYNDGWDRGYHYGIRQWEIWNEPDLTEFWDGTPQQFYDLYRRTVSKIRQYDPSLRVGMAGFAIASGSAFLEQVMDSVRTNNTPLDFFSYHAYQFANPFHYLVLSRRVGELLASYGLSGLESRLTEWNNYPYHSETTIDYARDDALSASLTASSFYYLLQTPLTSADRYRTDEYFFGLFRDNGDYSYSGQAFRALGRFKAHDQMLQTAGSDTLGTVVLAGKSRVDNDFSVLVSNPNRPANTYSVRINHLTSTYDYQIERIDDQDQIAVVDTGTLTPENPIISMDVQPPFVDFFSFSPSVGTAVEHTVDPDGPAFEVYPNPTSRDLFILSSAQLISGVTIYDTTGRSVLSKIEQRTRKLKIDLSSLVSGSYLVRVRSEDRAPFDTRIILVH